MTVRIDRRGAILVVEIDRPDVRNAVDRPTADALDEAFARFDDDRDLAVGVLTGAGGTFCAGADLQALASSDPDRVNRVEAGPDGPMGPSRRTLGKPVIAAIEGHAVAGGLELALWCDLRVMAADATLGVFCRRWGVPLIDGGTVRLQRIVGLGRALDLILTGRPVDAEEARAIGLVDRIAPAGGALAAAVELAETIASFPQTCVRSDRASVYATAGLPVAEALQVEHHLGTATLDSGETVDGARRFAAGAGRHGEFAG